jgi:hypothetical protein
LTCGSGLKMFNRDGNTARGRGGGGCVFYIMH